MEASLRDGEVRLIIKPAEEPADSSRLIPVTVFQRTFTTVLRAIKTTDSEIHGKKHRSAFFISYLAMGSNVIGVCEQPRSAEKAVDFFRQVAGAVYRSEFGRAGENEKIARAIVAVGKAIDTDYPALAIFQTDEIPLDGFFAKQAERLERAISPSAMPSSFFAGSTIGTFNGTLGNIDYRGPTWLGHLVLPGVGAQIECIFDRSRGEDAFNPFGNKRVSVSGRAIYTGDSQLPERIEVHEVSEIPLARTAIDIRDTLTGKRYFRFDGSDNSNLQ